MVSNSPVQTEDLVAVGSRIRWGAIVAGSVLSLALYFLLTLLGGAIGFSVSDRTTAQELGMAAAVWAIGVTAVCLFVGGFVSSQFTVGENKSEAAVYGLLVWAVVFGMLLWLMATGVRVGFNAMIGVATAGNAVVNVNAQNANSTDWESAALRAGFDRKQIDDVKQRVKDAPAQAQATIDESALRVKADVTAREAAQAATTVTWLTFAGTLLSMLAAAAGGYVGSGPALRLFAFSHRPLVRV